MPRNVTCVENEAGVLRQLLPSMDLVIGALLISTRETLPLVTTEMVKSMKNGSMIVDVTCGYGPGYLETFDRETTLEDPVFERFGVLHCKIAKLPGGVPVTSAQALSRLCQPYLTRLARLVHDAPATIDPVFAKAEVTKGGKITNPLVAAMLK